MPTLIVAPEQLPPAALRTEIPTVVADRCEDACDLAVWRAIRWLIAINGRERLAVDARTIAAHAKLDVKTALRCINGDHPESRASRRPRHLKRGLVGLGLIEVVGHQAVGKLKPRPVYRIPRWIEEQNAQHTLALLARLGLEPPAPAPSPAQAGLPFGLDPFLEQAEGEAGIEGVMESRLDPKTEQLPALVPILDQAARPESTARDPKTEQLPALVPILDHATLIEEIAHPDALNPLMAHVTPDPKTEQGVQTHANSLDPNSEHGREGRKEGGREGVVPPPVQLAAGPPAPPASELWAAHPRWVPGALPAHPRDLWRRACAAHRLIDDDQLAALASEHDGPTEGNGLYWVGRAILAAALNEDVRGVAKVRRTMERWRSEDSYGSDAPAMRRLLSAPDTTARRRESEDDPFTPRSAGAAPARGNRPSLAARLGLLDVFKEI